jgi:sporulation protein YlmC with PRC-barrel domain
MLDISNDTNVYTARDEHVGSVDRIVLDPETRAVSHVVVAKGVFFREDRLVPIGDIATATAERINLRQEVKLDDLQPFAESYYEPLPDEDRPAGLGAQGLRLSLPMSGPVGEVMPAVDAELVPVNRRNIPDRLTTVDAGAVVLAADDQEVGRLERILTSEEGQPTHIVIEDRGLSPDLRALPIAWVADITERSISLAATREDVEAVPPSDPNE